MHPNCEKKSLPAAGSFGPFAHKMAKRVRNEFPGLLESLKSPERSRKTVKTVETSIFFLVSTLFWAFGAPGPRGPGNSFRTLCTTLSPKGPHEPWPPFLITFCPEFPGGANRTSPRKGWFASTKKGQFFLRRLVFLLFGLCGSN